MAEPYDILSTYTTLLASDPSLTHPIAAIQSLLAGLAPATTAAETLELVTSLTTQLLRGAPPAHRVALTAGTDLFQKFLETGGTVHEGAKIAENATRAREQAAVHGARLVRDGDTVLTTGASRCVDAVLRRAAEKEGKRFKIIFVTSLREKGTEAENVATLRGLGIPVAEIPATAVAHCMAAVTKVLVGAEGVVKNGGIVSRMGTYQIAELAKGKEKPFYAIAETHKFTRLFPLTQFNLGGVEQDVLDFRPAEEEMVGDEGVADLNVGRKDGESVAEARLEDAVDYTPPHLISAIVTESGVKVTGAVADIITKMWM